MYVGCWKCGKPIGSETHFEIERKKGHFYDVCEDCYKKWKLKQKLKGDKREKMKCEHCGLNDIDGVIKIGNQELRACSPECMDKLLKKYKQKLKGDKKSNGK